MSKSLHRTIKSVIIIQFDIHKNWTKSISSTGLDCIWTLSVEDFDAIPYTDEIQNIITVNARAKGGYYSEGALIQNGISPEIYIYQNNSVFLIPNLQTFMAMGRDFSEVKRVFPSCFDQIGATKELPSA